MDSATEKKLKNRKKKRNSKSKRRLKRKLAARGATNRRTIFSNNIPPMRDEPQSHTMDARSFWENYKVAQEWQQRHSVAWWKSRCRALEYENHALRQKVRNEGSKQASPPRLFKSENNVTEDVDESKYEEDASDNDENFEFEVDKHMLNFLEQSVRHKMELKQIRESETEESPADPISELPFVTVAARERAKMEDARLLYGDASPGIMAMEAALQATVDRHKDRAKPYYWPNIPLKL